MPSLTSKILDPFFKTDDFGAIAFSEQMWLQPLGLFKSKMSKHIVKHGRDE